MIIYFLSYNDILLQNGFVMSCHNQTYISHGTLTNLDGALVEYLLKTIVAWKIFTNLYQFLKCFTVPILVLTFLEYRGLNHVTLLFMILFLLAL